MCWCLALECLHQFSSTSCKPSCHATAIVAATHCLAICPRMRGLGCVIKESNSGAQFHILRALLRAGNCLGHQGRGPCRSVELLLILAGSASEGEPVLPSHLQQVRPTCFCKGSAKLYFCKKSQAIFDTKFYLIQTWMHDRKAFCTILRYRRPAKEASS